jgi:Protein of unknown function (DUF3137)
MIEMPNVDALMAGGLQQWLDGKTAERAKARERVLWTRIAGVILCAAILLIALVAGINIQFAMFAIVLVGGGFFQWASHIRQVMVDDLKQEMNGALARALGIAYNVDVVSGAEFDEACEYDLLPSYDDRYLQDQWAGSVADTDIMLYEAKLTEERGSGKNRRTVTVFRGIVLQMRFARAFTGTTLVRREGFKFTLFGDDKNYGGETLERIKMVDPQFEDAFDVYGSDQVEARYLVHPAYCERLLDLERNFAGKNLTALFRGGDLLVTIQSEDMFESATLNPSEDRDRLAQTIQQFASIEQLVRKLNERSRVTA